MAFLDDRQKANFFGMVSPEPNTGCWLWSGYVNGDGYGKFNVRGRIESAHRVSYREHRGEIPPGYLALHKCDQPCCVNPDHLRIGTDAENADDKARRRRVPTKLTDQQVLAIRKETGPYRGIASKFDISPAWVCRIKSGSARIYAKEQS